MSTTSSGQQAADSLNGKLTFEQDKNRIIGRDEDNNIGLLIGTDPFVVKIAKDGFDVLTAGNDDLIFNSAQNVFKIISSGTLSIPGITFTTGSAFSSSSPTNVTLAHGLGYTPAFLGFINNGSSYITVPHSHTANTSVGFQTATWTLSTDSTNIYGSLVIFGYNYAGAIWPTYTVKYFLLQETAS